MSDEGAWRGSRAGAERASIFYACFDRSSGRHAAATPQHTHASGGSQWRALTAATRRARCSRSWMFPRPGPAGARTAPATTACARPGEGSARDELLRAAEGDAVERPARNVCRCGQRDGSCGRKWGRRWCWCCGPVATLTARAREERGAMSCTCTAPGGCGWPRGKKWPCCGHAVKVMCCLPSLFPYSSTLVSSYSSLA